MLSIQDLWIHGAQRNGSIVPILRGIEFEVQRGEVLALIGESGAGKSSIGLAALGYVRPGCVVTRGRAVFDGIDLFGSPSGARRRIRGRRVAYVAQSSSAAFNPALRIGAQVTEPQTIHHLPRERRESAIKIYRRLGLPEPEAIGLRYPHQVSGGQLQRLMLAMAMICGPDLVVLDEPTTALDVTTQMEVLATIKKAIEEIGVAALFVSHDLAVVAQIAHRILVLRNGEMVEQGPTTEIIARPTTSYTRELMAAVRPVPTGTDLLRLAPPKPSVENVAEVRSVTARYRGTRDPALIDMDLSVGPGEAVGVVGESGSGKTTLARVVAGSVATVSGEVLLRGRRLEGLASRRSRDDLRRIQIIFQSPDTSLNPQHTVEQILGRPLRIFFERDEASRDRRITDLLDLVELPAGLRQRRPGELSGGQKQRVAIARALAAEPDLIICDEITSSLDTVIAASVIETIRRLKREVGLSLLFISHDLTTVAAIADRVHVLFAGRTVEHGSTREIFSPPHHPYTRLLLSSIPELRQGWLEQTLRARKTRADDIRPELQTGCAFRERCDVRIPGRCGEVRPRLVGVNSSHAIACHHESAELARQVSL